MLDLINKALDLPEGYLHPYFEDPILTLRPIHYTAEVSDVQDGVFGAGMPLNCTTTTQYAIKLLC